MLILSRKTGEKLVIDGSITITVVESRCGRVKLGVKAPPHIVVMRSELIADPKIGKLQGAGWGSGDEHGDIEPKGSDSSSVLTMASQEPLRNVRKIPR